MTEIQLNNLKIEEEITVGELKVGVEFPKTGIITKPLTVTENGVYKGGTEDGQKVVFNPVMVEVKPDKATMVKEFIKARGTAEGLFYMSPLEDVSDLIEWDTFEGQKNLRYLFQKCANLKSLPLFDMSACAGAQDFINGANSIKTIPAYDTSSLITMDGMFRGSAGLEYLPMLNTRRVQYFNYAFSDCKKLREIPAFDARNAISMYRAFYMCTALENIWIRNISKDTQVGSGTSWGHLLTLESLVHLISELRNRGGTQTFTVGSANLEKLANVYVRPVEITDEMRANDDLIDEKLPFEVCESTDEGAVLITQYAKFKNWDIQ
jgi:hypothetical protein